MKRKVWIKTFGCQMNYHDTERLLYFLQELNFYKTNNREDADLIIFNTCAIRDLANKKFYSQLGEIKRIKEEKKNQVMVGIGGCVSQLDGKELIQKYKFVDFVFGTDTIDEIVSIVLSVERGDKKKVVNSFDSSSDYSIETKITHNSPQAFINIMKGCNNFCSYCIVPYTRGREKSRKTIEVVKDIKRLVETKGISEITLLGQNVNSFGKENRESFTELLNQLEKITALKRLKYTTSHPYDMSDELIEFHGVSKKLVSHIHLPVQSGSNSVLKRMKRKYTREHYLKILEKLRTVKSDIVISSDIIVSFPNETEGEFKDTLDLLDRAQFDFIYAYNFSPRAGTYAFDMKDDLTAEIRKYRLPYLQNYQLDIQKRLRQKLVGTVKTILVEGSSEYKGEKQWKGRSNCNRLIHFKGKKDQNYQWHWVDVKINYSSALSCQGELI